MSDSDSKKADDDGEQVNSSFSLIQAHCPGQYTDPNGLALHLINQITL
ncbi:12028_t:CDS:2 [Ambispora gerdemannii]|uniref:12028_t:CDS:1 n=1 Tax=Ambispora gerdemannii TaxID=144530 RepID=A0A9N9DJB5_9GLOM|nr:12028_t:CDS:2 [Ambispora gerdemannii]